MADGLNLVRRGTNFSGVGFEKGSNRRLASSIRRCIWSLTLLCGLSACGHAAHDASRASGSDLPSAFAKATAGRARWTAATGGRTFLWTGCWRTPGAAWCDPFSGLAARGLHALAGRAECDGKDGRNGNYGRSRVPADVLTVPANSQ